MTLEEQINQNIFDKYERKNINSPYNYVGREKYNTWMVSNDLVDYRNVLSLDTPPLKETELNLIKEYEVACDKIYKKLDNKEISAKECNETLQNLNESLSKNLNQIRNEEKNA